MADGRDIYGRIVELGQPLAADAMRLIFPDIGETDVLVQNVNIQYQQNVNRLWEVGSAKTFFIAGRTTGTGTISRVIGGQGFSTDFYKTYGDVCGIRGNSVTMRVSAGCTATGEMGAMTLVGVVVTSIGYAIQAADMIINENLSLLFAKLTLA